MTKDEDTVLRAIYDHRDDPQQPSVASLCAWTHLSRQIVRRCLRSLEEAKMISGPPDLFKTVTAALKDQDGNFTATDPGYAEHVLLMVSAISRADEAFLAEELDYDLEFVNIVGARLRASGIWTGDHLNEEHRENWCQDGGGVSFYLAGAVATGDLVVVGKKDGKFQWQMTDAGLKRGAKMIKGMSK